MLTEQTRAVIKQTVPILKENGEALTRHFYQRMFTQDPQVKAFFNPAHQHAGTQQRALAAAVLAYAEHIDDPSALASAIDLIAHKHVSLGVEPEHYPIVGKHLLGSIKELLGDAATDDIINAWGEAYALLADVCIQREKQLYDDHRDRHGWTGFRDFTIERIEEESQLIRSFYLKPADGKPLADFLPGQYITVRFPREDTVTTMRNYSLSGPPNPDYYRISVKREPAPSPDAPAGYVSHYLHEQVAVGDTIKLAPPSGNFTLDPQDTADQPLVLLAGGVGITPLLAMLHASLKATPDRPVALFQAARNSAVHAFPKEVRQLADQHKALTVHFRYSDPLDDDVQAGRCHSTGLADADLIRALTPDPAKAQYYYCGPKPFMDTVHAALDQIGVPATNRHYEFFGPAQTLKAGTCPVAH